MKVFALRDRFLKYFLQPFTAKDVKQVQASLADTINGDTPHAIAKAPHHFELWQLAEIDEETGDVVAAKDFLFDCGALVRTDIRQDRIPSPHTGAEAPLNRAGAHQRRRGEAEGSISPTADTVRTEALAAPEGAPGANGVHNGTR